MFSEMKTSNSNKKRDSIFSNSSMGGFNSALFLPSEFNTESQNEVRITINDTEKYEFGKINEFESLSQSRQSNSNYESSNNNSFINSPEKKEVFNFNSPFKKVNFINDRRFSTPMNPSQSIINSIGKSDSKYRRTSILQNQSTTFDSSNMMSLISSKFTSGQSKNLNEIITYKNNPNNINNLNMNVNNNPYQNYPSYQTGALSKVFNINPIGLNMNYSNNLIQNPKEKSNFNKKEDKKKKKKEVIKEGDWICSQCQNLNFSFRIQCNYCSELKG